MGSRKNKQSQDVCDRKIDPMSVRWLEKYDKSVSNIWNKIPTNIGCIIATIATFLVGISISGDWLSIFVHARKQFGYLKNPDNFKIYNISKRWKQLTLEDLYLHDVGSYVLYSCIGSYVLYFGVGGFLHWYYYVRQRDRSEEWKCQPNKWLSPDLERHEIILGTLTLFVNSAIGGVMASYVANGGYSCVYYKIEDYGWLWFAIQFPILFVIQDYIAYLMHRLYHVPILYKYFHKLHHKYKQPTAFSVTAIHPVESAHYQVVLAAPLFLFPVHWVAFYTVAIYSYYHGILDHSGICFKAQWWQPWQAPSIFHDNHHQYFHVNFGFNLELFDYMHGTHRRKDRVYTEDSFGGQGKSFDEATTAELEADLTERMSENPLAYPSNTNENKLTKSELKKLKKNS